MSDQLVYWQIPQQPRSLCRPLSEVRSAVPPPRGPVALCLVGSIAQFDECEDECDPETHVPVRYRGRVMAAPLAVLRTVG